MGLRTRIKNRVGGLLGGRKDSAAAGDPPAAATPAPRAPAASAPAAAAPAPRAPAPPAPAPRAPVAPAPAAAAPPGPDRVADEKKREARLKAKKAVLQFLIRQGGTANMKEMHDFSEQRYFVAHKAFSDLMEEYLEEGLLLFDQETYVATLTDGGRHFVQAATHIKTREKD